MTVPRDQEVVEAVTFIKPKDFKILSQLDETIYLELVYSRDKPK